MPRLFGADAMLIRAFRERCLFACLALTCALSQPARAQCPNDWLPGEGHPGVTGELPVWALAAWDPDGAGPGSQRLIAGGGFQGAGDVASFGIAAWDGATWSGLGDSGLTDQVFALTVFDGDVIAAGDFPTAGGMTVNRIARWDGEAWHPLGSGVNGGVRALAVYAGELYAGGFFTQAGGVAASGIARWDGTAWQGVGGGVTGTGGGLAAVFALAVFGDELAVAGGFASAGGVPAKNVARWNGSAWTSMAGSTASESLSNPSALAVYDGHLILAANVFSTGGQFLRTTSRWDPASATWQSMGNGPSDIVNALAVYDGDLYAGGIFTSVGAGSTPARLARWNGHAWFTVPAGPGAPARRVHSLAVFGGDLIAGGVSTKPDGEQQSQIGRWDGAAWHEMGGGVNSLVMAVASHEGDLYIGGPFTTAGDIAATGIARRNAAGDWDAPGGGVSGDCCGSGTYVSSMVQYDDALVVSGSFTHAGGLAVPGIARWDGSTWSAFGSTFAGHLFAHGGELYGVIAAGSSSAVARWNPLSQQWQALGALPTGAVMTTLGAFQGDLIAGGIGVDPAPAAVYRWDFGGRTWHPMGGTFGFNTIQALAEYDGQLVAGGFYDFSLGGPTNCIVQWNPASSSWQPLGGGLASGVVWDLLVFDGELIAGGQFSLSGGLNVDNVARWDGTSWSALAEGTDDEVLALALHGADLLLGGWFTSAGGAPNGHWARWGSTCPSPWVDLGYGLAGVSGIPSLAGTGTLIAGSPTNLDLSDAAPSTPAALVIGFSDNPTPFMGGLLVPVPAQLLLALTTGPAGTLALATAWPAGLPSAFSVFYQVAILDAAAVHGVALSNALQSTTP